MVKIWLGLGKKYWYPGGIKKLMLKCFFIHFYTTFREHLAQLPLKYNAKLTGNALI